MDLILADRQGIELGYVDVFERFDCEETRGEADAQGNSWILELPRKVWQSYGLGMGAKVYVPGTSCGGEVSRIRYMGEQVELGGHTWLGGLAQYMALRSGRLAPGPEALVHYDGEAASIMGALLEPLERYGLGQVPPGLRAVGDYRYSTLLSVLWQIAGERHRLAADFDAEDGQVKVGLEPVTDLDAASLGSDYGAQIDFSLDESRDYAGVYVLGGGQGEQRLRVLVSAPGRKADLAKDRIYIYDYNNLQTEAECIREGRKKLEALTGWGEVQVKLPVDLLPEPLRLGDCVTVVDYQKEVAATVRITKRILRMSPQRASVEYGTELLGFQQLEEVLNDL